MFLTLTIYVVVSIFRSTELSVSMMLLLGMVDAINTMAFLTSTMTIISHICEKKIAHLNFLAKNAETFAKTLNPKQ